MTPQPTTYPDNRIDDLLRVLGATEAPAGLEQRISARLAQAAEARTKSAAPDSNVLSYHSVILNAVKDPRSLLAPAKLCTVAALTLLLTLTTITLLHHHSTSATATTAQTTPTMSAPSQPHPLHHNITIANAETPAPTATQIPQTPSLNKYPRQATTQVPQTSSLNKYSSLATTQVPRGFSLGPHSSAQRVGVLTPSPSAQDDPDALALAETRAPSRPAPPMALTAQEQLLASAARPGQPLQLAALDQARAPALHAAAEAREDARIRRYIHAMLAPFALSDALSSNKIAEPREISTSTPAPHPPLALTN